MNFPKRHDLACYDGKFDFEGSGFCPQQWEISVRQKYCIIWSVVLSYLKSTNFAIPGQFESRLKQLIGNEVDVELAKDAVKDFNPFFNIHKCFFSETLQDICKIFRKLLEKKRETKERKASQDLPIISSMLHIKILIVDLNEKKLHVVEPEDNSSLNLDRITLIFKEHATEINGKPTSLKRFNFGLDNDLCCKLRKKALEILLESSVIKIKADEEILPMLDRGEKYINFVITLLKKEVDRESSVSSLYESWYVAGKLSDAGFETDPRALDSDGFSAFYYALQSSDDSLVYILYRYAANNCYETASTFRDPNPSIISNFSKLKEILSSDCARSRNFEEFGDRAEATRVTFQDLQTFNEFLTQVSQGIDGIRDKPEKSPLEVAIKQRERILLILEKYDAFYSVGQIDSQPISEEELIENYTKHKTYYNNLDFTVALLFFDNIFLLKGVLKSPREGLYSELESSFLLSAITNKYFTGDNTRNGMKLKDLGFDSDSNHFSIIPLLERLNLREKVRSFCSILKEKWELDEEKDTVRCIPQKEIDGMLSNYLTLKDEFLISRLDHYMKTALETAPEGLKQIFVIERSLQVIGESINIEEANPSSIRHLLRKCFPDETLEVLKKTRNTLSHLKSFQFPLKFDIEVDTNLFTIIQSEIRNIKKVFEKVFDIQRIRLIEFLINRGLESVQRFQEDAGIDMHTLVLSMKNFGVTFRQKRSELEGFLDQTGTDGNCVIVPGITKFWRKLMGFASRAQEDKIRGEVPSKVKSRVAAVQELEQDLDRGIVVDVDRFDNLFLKKKDIGKIKKEYTKYLKEEFAAETGELSKRKEESEARSHRSSKTESEVGPGHQSKRAGLLHKIKNSSNPLNTLDSIFEKNKVSESQLKLLHEEIPFSVESKKILDAIIEISKGPCGDNLANLLNRIEHLYRISVDEQFDIRFLWERVKSPKAKQYLVYKIVQRYFREPSFQAALETLLFDCVGILKNNEDFRYFWLKDSYLFNGIDVRNVLAHGDPLVESIGDILDPKDLPSELVKKMLQLFEDRECIEALCNLWMRVKETKKAPDKDWYKARERVFRCCRWENYSKLLVEKPKDVTDAVLSFLKNVPEPKDKKGRNCNSESSGT
ncbi:unnamed protein product [Larinioides sclopetarius]|uniref:Uncharacterized protein n=1 Tax=Larinioides sclopetarius TaxID=280406 RepID=A0AAV2AS70_9ARAC